MVEPDLDARLVAALERLAHARRVLLQRAATAEGLSPLQSEVLRALVQEVSSPPRVNALAKELGVSSATMADAVTALVTKAMVEQAPDPDDGRRRRLRITSAGRRAVVRIEGTMSSVEAVLAPIGSARKATSLGVLLEAIGALYAEGVITVDRSCRTCTHFVPAGSADGAHRCSLLRRRLNEADLRVNCAEHHPAA